MSAVIEVQSLTKRYGSIVAVDDVSFAVEPGSVFAFLGPNGAGKSTTIGCLTTLQSLDSGAVTVAGHIVGRADEDIRAAIGVVFQSSLLDPLMSVRENLETRARFYRVEGVAGRIAELSELIGLDSFVDRRYGSLSGGQRRRADVARALIHRPSILFLDEPTAGLDPQSRERVWQTIYDLRASIGLTIFLTTHYLEETERADMVYVIDGGRIVAHGTPNTLRASYSRDELRLVPKLDGPGLAGRLQALGVESVGGSQGLLVYPDSSRHALDILGAVGSDLEDFEFRHGTMDDVFLRLTGFDIREEDGQP